jgi:tRNA splicing ligase
MPHPNQRLPEELSQEAEEYKYLTTICCSARSMKRLKQFLKNQSGEADDSYVFAIERNA